MGKPKNKGFKASIGKWTYENKKVNRQLLKLKKSADEMSDLLKGRSVKK